MSIQLFTWALNQRLNSPARKLLLLVLANFADDEGVCWASQDALSAQTGQRVDAVKRNLSILQQLGLIAMLQKDGAPVVQLLIEEHPR